MENACWATRVARDRALLAIRPACGSEDHPRPSPNAELPSLGVVERTRVEVSRCRRAPYSRTATAVDDLVPAKPLCRHRLQAATVPRPLILHCALRLHLVGDSHGFRIRFRLQLGQHSLRDFRRDLRLRSAFSTAPNGRFQRIIFG